MEHIGEAIFDIPFMIQSHAESMKKILGALQDLPAKQHSQFSHSLWNWAGLAVLVTWQILKGSQDFLYTFNLVLYHKWDVNVLQFFSLISDSLGGVTWHYCLYFFCPNIERTLLPFDVWVFLLCLLISFYVRSLSDIFIKRYNQRRDNVRCTYVVNRN